MSQSSARGVAIGKVAMRAVQHPTPVHTVLGIRREPRFKCMVMAKWVRELLSKATSGTRHHTPLLRVYLHYCDLSTNTLLIKLVCQRHRRPRPNVAAPSTLTLTLVSSSPCHKKQRLYLTNDISFPRTTRHPIPFRHSLS